MGTQTPGRRKVPTMPQALFLLYSKFASERAQVQTWGRQTWFLPRAPSNLGTPLEKWNLDELKGGESLKLCYRSLKRTS